MAMTIGTQLASLQITALLDRGGFGEVYRARQQRGDGLTISVELVKAQDIP